jgi:HAD superfamily hydrolase (TIGR01509 family)
MDGTLVDSETLCNQAYKDLIPEITVPVESLVGLYRGRKLAWIFNDIEKRFNCSLPDTFEQNYRQRVATLFDSNLKAFPRVHEALESIEMPICIATSAPLKKVNHVLSITGLAQYFDENLFSSYEIGSWKPEPDIFLHAAKSMNVSPSNCLVVEDSAAGIEAALSAGMKVAQFCNVRQALCDTIFSDYGELVELISTLRAAG